MMLETMIVRPSEGTSESMNERRAYNVNKSPHENNESDGVYGDREEYCIVAN